jgi:methylated-DNA-[protein]-cysteine S-methyltransferase
VYDVLDSPVGELILLGDGESLSGLVFANGGQRGRPFAEGAKRSRNAFAAARVQLAEYFAGTRKTFDLPLQATGTAFQRRAWNALTEIPYGTTRTYGEQAAALGRPGAARAVGAANGRNPIPIIVPCHRLVGHDGALTGFGGGLERKRYLLEHEATVACRVTPAPAAARV